MPHHYTKNVLEDTRWCNTCNRRTQHQVYNGRLGRCLNDHHRPPAKSKEKAQSQQRSLFEEG